MFTAIDRRIEALRRNSDSDNTEPQISNPPADSAYNPPLPQFEDDDKESLILGEQNSSPESSPDCHVGSRTRHAPAINITTETKQKEVSGEDEPKVLEGTPGSLESAGDNDGKDGHVGTAELSTSTPDGGIDTIDKESDSATPPSTRSPSEEASVSTTISSSTDNATETNFSQ